jgi:hypothetical protein
MKTRYLGLLTGLAVLTSLSVGNAQTPDPCALLTVVELQPAFPGSKPGRTIRTLEKEGILSCEWTSNTGRIVLVAGADGIEDTPLDEAKTLMHSFVDPLRADAERHVRFETLPGVGDKAVAVLERQDRAKGITDNGVLLVVRRGNRQVALMAVPPGDLMRHERADALKILAELGRAIARRLS